MVNIIYNYGLCSMAYIVRTYIVVVCVNMAYTYIVVAHIVVA